MPEQHPIVHPIEMRGFNSLNPATTVYPDSPDLLNVRKTRAGAIAKRDGFTTYNSTAMPATTRAITGIAQFNRRDTTTRYTIVGTQEKLFVAPTSGAWTTLASSLGASATDYWDFAVFNNEIICVNGVATPQVSDGTAANTGTLGGRAWRTMTSSPTAVKRHSGSTTLQGRYYVLGGITTGTTQPAQMEVYETSSDTWFSLTKSAVNRYDGAGWAAQGSVWSVTGQVPLPSAGNVTSLERYTPWNDSWQTKTAITAATLQASGAGYALNDDGGNVIGGSSTANYRYEHLADTWSTKTAVNAAHFEGAGWTMGTAGYIAGGDAVASTTARQYNNFSDSYATLTAITNGHRVMRGAPGDKSGIGYAVQGGGDTDTATTDMQSYNVQTNVWTQETASPGAMGYHGAGTADYLLVSHGGIANGTYTSNGVATNYVFNVSPSAPVGYYVDTIRGYCVIARTSSYPSRVFYCIPGNAKVWPSLNWFDVLPDDGHWITGLFVYRNELYVSKANQIFRIPFSRLDPVKGDHDIIPVPDCPGTVSNRSIVVTDQGVFYLASDGFRLFNGATSHNISNKIKPTLDGYVQSRNKYCAGVWNTATDELWWSLTSTGSTHDRIVVYNMKWQEWYIWSGIAAESLAIVNDANDIDQILFGTGNASDGKVYLAASTNADNGAAINAYYQSGWFYPAGILTEFCPRELFLLTTRDGAWNLSVQTRRLFGTTNQTNDTDVNLLSGTYPDRYFQDASEQRARIQLGVDNNGYAQSIRFANANASQTFTVMEAIMTGHPGIGGYPVV